MNGRFSVVRGFDLSDTDRTAWLAQRASTVRAVITGGHVGCSSALMTALPSLGVIAINGVGVDKVDLQLARSRGVRVGTTPGALTDDVADLAVGLIIGLLRGIPAAEGYVRSGECPEVARSFYWCLQPVVPELCPHRGASGACSRSSCRGLRTRCRPPLVTQAARRRSPHTCR